MAIRFACGSCGKRLAAKDEHAGRRTTCSACGWGTVIPFQSTREADDSPEPPPVPPGLTRLRTDEDDDEPEPCRAAKPADAERRRPLWKDPVVVIGTAVPMSILLVFFTYLALPRIQAYASRNGSPEHKIIRSDRSIVPKTEQASQANSVVVLLNRSEVPTRNSNIPVEVSYPVIDEYREPRSKHGLDVRLNMKVSEDVLREIALELKSKEIEQYERTYIFYYLPLTGKGFKNKAPWAFSHFDPTLRVEIMGLTPEEERFLLSQPTSLPPNVESIGRWLVDNGDMKFRIAIGCTNNIYYQEVIRTSGGKYVGRLLVVPSSRGLVLKKEEGSDQYIIDSEGNLEIRDVFGLVVAPTRIK